MTVRGVLFPREFGGLANLDGLGRAAQSGLRLPFVSLEAISQNYFGMWVIEGVKEDASFFLAGGPLRDAYQISLKKYQRAGMPISVSSLISLI